jgi:hypothetical protein
MGSKDNGHYICEIKIGEEIYEFNDKKIKEIRGFRNKGSEIFLCYKKKTG